MIVVLEIDIPIPFDASHRYPFHYQVVLKRAKQMRQDHRDVSFDVYEGFTGVHSPFASHSENEINSRHFCQPDAADMAIAGEELRLAIRHLGKITGRVNIEDVLDVIFSDFCIGK
jgi:hypothetical protein